MRHIAHLPRKEFVLRLIFIVPIVPCWLYYLIVLKYTTAMCYKNTREFIFLFAYVNHWKDKTPSKPLMMFCLFNDTRRVNKLNTVVFASS